MHHDIACLSTSPLPALGGRKISRVQLLPLGKMAAKDGREPWFLENAAAVIAASEPYLKRGMPVDLDHALDRKQEAPAAGWIVRLEAASDGIWADIEWTPLGLGKIAGREYRYISPVFAHDRQGNVLWIERAGLTNNPALHMQAICSKEPSMTKPPAQGDSEDLLAFVSALRDALGLPQGSTSADLLKSVRELVGGAARKDMRTEIVEQVATAAFGMWEDNRKAENERRVNEAVRDAKVPPVLRNWALAMCDKNPVMFDEFVRTTPGFTHLLGREVYPAESEERARPNPVFDQLGLTGRD